MRPQILLLITSLAVLLLSAIAAADDAADSPVGPPEPIKDVHDPQVQFLAQVAVNSYNLEHRRYLILKEVVGGETQETRKFINYLLHIVVNQTSSLCYRTMIRDRKKGPRYREFEFFESEICQA
ncbi:cysteine proteinase inhibitor 5-like [Eucalyptus grandis]|uniref:cysteine proteinase inhibitor 5-like n=1 Tax=Eucalyptus grandis TaxID=71139 RepID=UPI00192EBCB0|nr:cysteine proteinase inhibitor 5-like [Eucalyptus grandis]